MALKGRLTRRRKSFLILLRNSNGLYSYKNELLSALNELNIDLAFITETHFTNTFKISFPGYQILHTNHPNNSAHDGAAFIIKSSIKYNTYLQFQTNYLQSSSIQIILNHIPITFASVYCLHRNNISADQFYNNFSSLGHKNTNWGCHSNNSKGVSMLKISNVLPTH